MYCFTTWILILWSVRVADLNPKKEVFVEWVYPTLCFHLVCFLKSIFTLHSQTLIYFHFEEWASLYILTPFSLFYYFLVRDSLLFLENAKKKSERRGYYGILYF